MFNNTYQSVFLSNGMCRLYKEPRAGLQNSFGPDATLRRIGGMLLMRRDIGDTEMDMNIKAKVVADTALERVIKRPSREEAEAAVRTLIAWTGDDPDREGLLDTPRRVVDAYR